jgi:putative cardiolipin synthase
MARKALRWAGIAVLLLGVASLLSLFAYGRFAERVRGPDSHALAVTKDGTEVDRAVVPALERHPGKTGLLVLSENLDAFAARALTARAAGRSLDLQYYIWHADFTGNLLHNEILRAADRGVRVRLLLDDMNVHGSHTVLAALDRHPLIEVRLFNPTRAREGTIARGVELLLRFVSLNRRMHNKAWIADGRIAVVGGRNIGNEYFDAANDVNFADTDVAVVGPAVAEAEAVFDAYWNSRSAIPLEALVRAPDGALERTRASLDAGLGSERAGPYAQRLRESPGVQDLVALKRPLYWTDQARIVSDPPEKAEGAEPGPDWLTPQLVAKIDTATNDARLISPYFVPGQVGVDWLGRLSQRGVKVGILTNSLVANDVMVVHSGYAPYRLPLLAHGIELFELKARGKTDASLFGSSGASLHTKAFVVDGRRGFIGSFNLDPRSVNLNTEMGLLFEEPGLGAELEALYARQTGPAESYRLEQVDGALRWHDAAAQPPRVWEHEPDAGAFKRAVVRVLSWLPLDSQL